MARKNRTKKVYVYADWKGLDGPKCMGVLEAELLRGREIFSFEYDEDWLRSDQLQVLDPDLQWFSGRQYLNDQSRTNFGMFLDSSPDRWGRILMRRREAAMAREEQRSQNNLFETDYLLGVYDGHRMGGLRFKISPDGPFLDDNIPMASPPWTSIRQLEQISLRLEDEDVIHDPDYLKWLNMLVTPGSSLGGARPKASVFDRENRLWIAKFPSKRDRFDIGGWEFVACKLAKEAGVHMAESKARRFNTKQHTFLTKRFDRTTDGARIHFASAMTLLGHMDGEDYVDGVSYLELLEFIGSHGAQIDEDFERLWRRIVFSICISNTDDHLRNHGFILTPRGWILSPAYDINPVETGVGLSLNISENDNALDLDLAMEVAPFFRLKEGRAREIVREVKQAVRSWRDVATTYGISDTEQDLKAKAFSKAKD